jgi:tetratricopeptide (TPR) repeat protein
VITNIGFWLAFTGQRATAEPFLRQGLQAAVDLGARADEAYAHLAMSWMLEQCGDWGAAQREGETALALARRIGHREWIASGLPSTGRIARVCGAHRRARSLHEEMLATARELGQDLVALGDPAEGERCVREAIATAAEAVEFILIARLALADLQLAQQQPALALETAQQAENEAGDYRAWRLDARRLRAESLIALGRFDEAEPLLDAVETEARGCGIGPVVWPAALTRADLLAGREAHR